MINKKLILSWLLASLPTYPIIGFLNNFYQTEIEVSLLTILTQTLFTISLFYLLKHFSTKFQSETFHTSIALILYIIALLFVIALIIQANQYPSISDLSLYQINSNQSIYFLTSSVLSLPLSYKLLHFTPKTDYTQTRLYQFLENHINGLLIALILFSGYIFLTIIFNQPAYDADDIFFDADSNLYRARFATQNYADYYFRPFHPYILLIIRPIVWSISLLLKGNMLFAAYITNALTGALCVFLVWVFVKHTSKNSLYALLITTLFGISTSQIVFSTILETYIFSTATILIFILLLIKHTPLPTLVFTGLATFGITLTNPIPTVIAHFFIKPNLKQLTQYILLLLLFIAPLSLLNNFIYPNAQPYFWQLNTLPSEEKNSFPINFQRAHLLGRVMLLHSIVAPTPLIIDDGFPFIKTWMFRATINNDPMQIATYQTRLGNSLAYLWLALILLAGFFTLKNFRNPNNRFSLTFILILLFNFIFYLSYGMDVFLYSPNWLYAFILLLSLAWQEIAHKRWFQIVLLTFIILLFINNFQLINTMLSTSAPSVQFPSYNLNP
jgi:hypothetical protein